MDIHEEADNIVEGETIKQDYGYVHDPRYQKLSQRYLEAVTTKDWKQAHDLLVTIDLIKERFSRGEWVLNGDWE